MSTKDKTKEVFSALTVAESTIFNYDGIPDEDVQALETSAKSIRKYVNEGRIALTELMLAIGEQLLGAQERLANHGDGGFHEWCKQACGLSKSSVYNYLSAVRMAQDCPTVGQSCEATALYRLSSKQCPEEARNQAIELVKGGEFITTKRAKELIADCSPAKSRSTATTNHPARPKAVSSAARDPYSMIANCVEAIRSQDIAVFEIIAALRRAADELEFDQQHDECAETSEPAPVKQSGKCSGSPAAKKSSKASSGKKSKRTHRQLSKRLQKMKEAQAIRSESVEPAREDGTSEEVKTVKFKGVAYECKMDGQSPFWRRLGAGDGDWCYAEGTMRELIESTFAANHHLAETVIKAA